MSGSRRRWTTTARTFLLLALLVGVSACGGGGDSLDDGGVIGGGGGEDGGEVPAPDEGGDRDGDRQVVTTGWMAVVVADPLKAAEQAARIVEAAGGRVDDQTERPGSDDEGARATLTLRIPAARLSGVLDEIEALGELDDLSLSREDVTLTVRDLDARIGALEVSIARLEELMASATSTADLLEAERALTERQAELDSLRAQRTVLGEQVALATIRLDLLPEAPLVAPSPGGFWGGVTRGWTALLTTLDRSIEVIGAILPWALFGGVITGIWVLLRRSRAAGPAAAPRPVRGPRPGGPRGWRVSSAPSGAAPSPPTPYPSNGGTAGPRTRGDGTAGPRTGGDGTAGTRTGGDAEQPGTS